MEVKKHVDKRADQPQKRRKNKGVTETDNSSMVGRGGSISANYAKSAKPINSSI